MPVINAKNALTLIDDFYDRKNKSCWTSLHRIDTLGGDVQVVKDAIQNYPFEKLIYAEGDSWFDKFSPLLHPGTNLLDAIRLPMFTGVVDVSHIGDISHNMVNGHQRRQTVAMFDLFDFDVILYSGGGNDLKNYFADLYSRGRRTVPKKTTDDFFDDVIQNIKSFVSLRDKARSRTTRSAPIFVNGYDYLQPRPVRGSIIGDLLKVAGPWLYPSMNKAGLSDAEMFDAAQKAIDKLNDGLRKEIAVLPEVYVIDQCNLLRPAPPGSTTPSDDWIDEIHPSASGFTKLARNRWDYALAKALGWVGQAGDTKPA